MPRFQGGLGVLTWECGPSAGGRERLPASRPAASPNGALPPLNGTDPGGVGPRGAEPGRPGGEGALGQ